MDITSPGSLWKDYDASTLPLNAYALSQKIIDGMTVKEYYFDGYITVDGRVRAFIRVHEKADAKGVVLFMGDSDGKFDGVAISEMYRLGYTVAALDYMGVSQTEPHYTFYPDSLQNCNQRGAKTFGVDAEANHSPWYIWACVARRATKFLLDMYPNKKVFAMGIGLGGSTVYKLTTFDDGLNACATLLNIIPKITGEGNQLINYHASLDNYSYSSLSKVPLFVTVASNDEDGSLDDMSDLAKDCSSLEHFRIIERAFENGIPVAFPYIDSFFQKGSYDPSKRVRPKITASNSEGKLYFNITDARDESEKDDENYKLNLFVSFCVKDPPYRNWMNIQAISLGRNNYISQINVCDNRSTIYAFANFTDSSGDTQSSALFSIVPKSIGIVEKEGVIHHKIYEGSMGADGWTSRRGGKTTVIPGPYGIDGITNDKHTLTTFKPGDPLFRVPADTILQIMACGKRQTLTVKMSDGENDYSSTVNLNDEEDWTRFTFAHSNFKNFNSTLPDWSKIVMLEIDGTDDFLIGSVLWI